jgi:hypothetical protein
MRRCIIHIGTHKTGSSSIQRSLLEHAPALLRAGIEYRSGQDSTQKVLAHHRMSAGLKGGQKAERLAGLRLTDLEGLLNSSPADTVVLSSEGFSHPRVKPARLRQMLGSIRACGFSPTAVVYLRAQPSLANSSYTQAVKTFAFAGTFDEFLEKRMSDIVWNYEARLAAWIKELGPDLVPIPFTPENTGPRIAEKMLAFGGVPPETLRSVGMKPAEVVNDAPGPMAVAAFRLLMRARPELSGRLRQSDAHLAALQEVKKRGWDEGRFIGLDSAKADRLEAVYGTGNDAFARRFFDRPWRVVFAADYEREWRSNEIDIDHLPEPLAAELADFVSRHG